MRQQSLAGAFALPNDDNLIWAFRDVSTGLNHLGRSSKLAQHGFSIELPAYQFHVYLDWRALRPDAEHRWDLLSDHLQGRGVAHLDEALLLLEVAPVHEALLALLQPSVLAGMAELSKRPATLPACGATNAALTPHAVLFERIAGLVRNVAHEALSVYRRKQGLSAENISDPWKIICPYVAAAAKLPTLESQFTSPWTPEAKAMLPSIAAEGAQEDTVLWGPILAWCVLRGLAEEISKQDAATTALQLFDRLRLREPLARAFSLPGQLNEDGWRAAARIRIAFLDQSLPAVKPIKAPSVAATAIATAAAPPFAGLPAALWTDDDARWLLNVHEAEGAFYFNRELHQQLICWTQLPDLLALAADWEITAKIEGTALPSSTPTMHKAIKAIEKRTKEASVQAKSARYQLGAKADSTAVPKTRATRPRVRKKPVLVK